MNEYPLIVQPIGCDDYSEYFIRLLDNKYKIVNIPLSMISFTNWNSDRYKHNMDLIISTNSVLPIKLGYYDRSLKKYTLNDGNHRCFCCNQLGYKYIPGIVLKTNTNINFKSIEI